MRSGRYLWSRSFRYKIAVVKISYETHGCARYRYTDVIDEKFHSRNSLLAFSERSNGEIANLGTSQSHFPAPFEFKKQKQKTVHQVESNLCPFFEKKKCKKNFAAPAAPGFEPRFGGLL